MRCLIEDRGHVGGIARRYIASAGSVAPPRGNDGETRQFQLGQFSSLTPQEMSHLELSPFRHRVTNGAVRITRAVDKAHRCIC